MFNTHDLKFTVYLINTHETPLYRSSLLITAFYWSFFDTKDASFDIYQTKYAHFLCFAKSNTQKQFQGENLL